MTTFSNDLTFIADTSPDGKAKTCAGPFPPVLVDERASLKVPFLNIVKAWTAPSSTSLTALRIPIQMVNKSCANVERSCNLLKDGTVDRGSFNPGRVLPRRVLIDQCQGSVDAVE